MSELLARFDAILNQTAPKVATRLQPGLTIAEIEKQIASFSWQLPQDAFDLYLWHNGLSGIPGKLNLVEKLLRVKGKWHGELSGRENEVHLQLENRPIIAKFLPLNYALAGHRHLKLGRCPIDLLPFSILTDANDTIYCMMRLDPENPIVYCANGTNLPPMKVNESFLSTQPQFSRLSTFIMFLTTVCQQGIQPLVPDRGAVIDCEFNLMQFEQSYQQYKC
jgi:hypothetical protein